MKRAFDILDSMETSYRKTIVDKIELRKDEIVKWKEISIKMTLIFNSDFIIEQFEGYFNLKELDWDDYRKRYKDIHRLDRILKAEGKSPDEYKLAKQADVLMLFYVLKPEEVIELIKGLSYKVPEDFLERNLDYYINRTSHGSTLSRVVHAYLAGITWKPEICRDLYMEALSSDYTDIQGGTTAEGIHAGVMGGTVLFAISMFGGLNWRNEILSINPEIPNQWQSLSFKFLFQKNWYSFSISKHKIIVKVSCYNTEPVHIIIKGVRYELNHDKELMIEEVEK
jgi:trehalose/maltose hydrolase-like predicted phosphorylase